MEIIATGDIHGKFRYLNALINKYKDRLDLVLCGGDFGYWPNFDSDHENIKTHGIPVLWCDGNHENHWALRDRKSDEIAENVFYMPRGSTYKLEDGRTILFMGGADSIDKDQRTIGRDWFPEEVITQKDMMNLPDVKVDIIVSHTCPTELYPTMLKHYDGRSMEPSNYALSEIWKIYKPDLWFFGHWHYYKEGNLGDTKWYALGKTMSSQRWWRWVPTK
jgi:Icc-related predicted phosphoesterase